MSKGSFLIKGAFRRVKVKKEVVNTILKFVDLCIIFGAGTSILRILNVDITALLAGVGIVGIAVGFAAKDIISNWISGVFLLFERVYVPGDIIQVGEQQGKVKSIGLRATVIQTLEGNDISIPNSILATSQVINLTSRRNELIQTIKIPIDYLSDVKKAKELMLEAAKEVKGTIVDEKHQPYVVTNHDTDWGISLILYVTTEVRDRDKIFSALGETIKKKFDEAEILPPIPPIVRAEEIRERLRKG